MGILKVYIVKDMDKGEILLEKQLIIEIKKGDWSAFRRLYDLYFDYAIRVAAAVTNNPTIAADIVQETFIRVYTHIEDFDEERDFKPWFYRILINECRRYLKKYAKVVPMEVDEQRIKATKSNWHKFEEYADLYEALQSLDDHHRIPLILKYIHDLTEMEIALALNLHLNTVKSRLYKAKRKLKGILDKKGGTAHEK